MRLAIPLILKIPSLSVEATSHRCCRQQVDGDNEACCNFGPTRKLKSYRQVPQACSVSEMFLTRPLRMKQAEPWVRRRSIVLWASFGRYDR